MMGSPNNRSLNLEKIYCDGVRAQKAGELITANPWPATSVEEDAAWDVGFSDAVNALADLSCCGYPDAGEPAPEILNSPRY
jgi:hypothetical protein